MLFRSMRSSTQHGLTRSITNAIVRRSPTLLSTYLHIHCIFHTAERIRIRFSHFFDTPRDASAAPGALGFDGFYKGAFSYHFHNFW